MAKNNTGKKEYTMSNACGSGFCSKGFNQEEVDECINSARKDWNGLCAYQDGVSIRNPDEEIELTCCKRGCIILAYAYASWNRLCAYQK